MTSNHGQHLVLVTGATGKQGGAVARQLLNNKVRVRAMTRKPDGDAARALARLGAEVVRGDFDDAESLRSVIKGVWGTWAVQNTWEAGVEREEEQGKRFVALAREGGVQHCVYSSVASAHRNTGIPHFENKWRVEGTLRAAGFPSYVIIRPVFFMENLITPWFLQGDALMTAMKPDTVLQMITVDDVGRYGALAFERPAQLNRAELDIAGDAATMTQAAAVLSSALGRRITFAQIPAEEVRKNSADFAAMLEWFERVGYNADIEGNALRYGIQNTTLTAWARKTLRPGPPAAGLHAQR